MTHGDALSNPTATARRSFGSVVSDHPLIFTLAALTGAVAVALIGFVRGGSDSDEAPIRVKNGSLELRILDAAQKWDDAGGSGKWRIKDKERHQNTFDVTVVPRSKAICGSELNAVEPLVRFSFSENNAIIILEASGKKTWVLPQNVSMTNPEPTLLKYGSNNGYVTRIEAGPTVSGLREICKFENKDQLHSIVILNLK